MIWVIVLVGSIIWGLRGISNRVTVTRTVYTRYHCPVHNGTFVAKGNEPQVDCPVCTETILDMDRQFDEGPTNLR
jgi:hypothetical protein